MKFTIIKGAIAAAVLSLCAASGAQAGVVDFTSGVPAVGDGAVDFSKTDMGVTFTFTPIINLVGGPHWVGNANGLSFGGGSGSSIQFDFVTDADVELVSYALGGGVIQLGNPNFNIQEGATVLSGPNQAGVAFGAFLFAGGPIEIDAGTTYSFVVNNFGAGIQRQMASWTFDLAEDVPEPIGLGIFASGLALFAARRRRRS